MSRRHSSLGSNMAAGPVKSAIGATFLAAMAVSYLSDNPDKAKGLSATLGGYWTKTAAQPTKPAPLFPDAPIVNRQLQRPAPQAGSSEARHVAAVSNDVGYGVVQIDADRLGQFHSDVMLEGISYHMVVDTGASYVSLSYDDAERLNHVPSPSDFKYTTRTANGEIKVAAIILREVRIQNLTVRDVPALVSQRGVSTPPLLGMSFLKKLKIRVDSGSLTLSE